MHETSKAIMRRLFDSRFVTRYFVGDGIDVGSGPDPLGQFGEFFPLMRSCRPWDVADGDAQLLESLATESMDFVHSSHCLEHMNDPRVALRNWLRVLRPGGHLIVIVPDEDMYEQGVFPSTFNNDHKWTFTIHKRSSWSPRSLNLAELAGEIAEDACTLKIEQLDATYRYVAPPRFDQTLSPIGECAVEWILRKHTAAERRARGRLPQPLQEAHDE